MEDFYNSSLIQSIKDKIKTNNNKGITGNILQEELLKIVSALDLGGMFLGFASKSTNPGNEGKSRANGFYFSTEEGTYTNFIGSNNQPLVIGSDLEIIYREVNNDTLTWNHKSIASQFSVSGEENNFASFDGNGGLQDSGYKANDFATAAQGIKADTALHPLSVGQYTENNFASFDSNGGIKDSGFSEDTFIKGVQQNGVDLTKDANGKVNVTVQDGEDGLSAFEIAQQQGYTGTVDQWLASLKANIGEFKFVTYDSSAESAFTTGGIGTIYSSTIDSLVAGTDTTSDVILLMNNTDGTTQPTKTMMIATQDNGSSGYEFVYAGDLQGAMPSNVLTQTNIVNNLTTGGNEDVLSAEQGKVIGEELYGEKGYVDVELTLETNLYYQYSSNGIRVDAQTLYGGTKSVRIQVQPGDRFKIYGADKATQESATRLWCFSDGTTVNIGGVNYYTVLSVADDQIDTRTDGAEIVAPAGSVYLTICFYGYNSSTDKLLKWQKVTDGVVGDIEDLENRVEALESQTFPSVVDNLESDSTTDALSAKQGKEIGEELYGTQGYVDVELQLSTDSYYACAVGSEPPYTIKTSPTSWADSGMACAQIQVQAGDKFKIYGLGNTTSTVLYAFADASNHRLTYASSYVDYRINGYELTAPEGAVRLVVNFKEYNSATDKLQKWGSVEQGLVEQVENLDSRVTALEEMKVVKSVLQGKNILVFGDSLVEFTSDAGGDGKTWCQHAAEISGATFINVGIGGTQLKSRIPMAHIFDASETYAVDDYVYYLTSEHYHLYQCTNTHTGAWDANDFTEVTDAKIYVGLDIVNLVTMTCDTNTSIESRFEDAYAAADCVKTVTTSHDNNTAQIDRLKAVDFSSVDAIVVMAGTNDYAGAFGNADSTDITEENGAINVIVEKLSTSYGTIPIYYVKEPVKWFPHTVNEEVVYTDDYWCDVYKRNNMTIAEYFDKISEQFATVNHIPVCDLYYGLGWNKYNFWNYFRQNLDGTHPYRGFRQIAEKIVSFIIANKMF